MIKNKNSGLIVNSLSCELKIQFFTFDKIKIHATTKPIATIALIQMKISNQNHHIQILKLVLKLEWLFLHL